MRWHRNVAVVLIASALLVSAGVGRLLSAAEPLPGAAADAQTVLDIRGRSSSACAAISDKCQGNRPESAVCITVGGVCAARSLGAPDTGSGAPCGTCTGPCHNTCSGAVLAPPLQCWETSQNCCTVTTACASGTGCQCLATGSPPQFIGTRIVCWNAPPAGGGGPPNPPVAGVDTMVCDDGQIE